MRMPKSSPIVPSVVSPNWSEEQDAALIGAAGRYVLLDGLARAWGRPVQHLLSRWHVLRSREGRGA
ncbi:hypothetical protein O4H61_03390 [Roseovarius aestuarii]|nr:hypothetical protein [Roseovarius aestuarii]